MKQRILILCTHNSARSQMAEGWFRHVAGDQYTVASAGTYATEVHPLAIQVMSEVGIDISDQRSKAVSEFAGQRFDVALTVCDAAADACPFFPGAMRRVHWNLPDPAEVAGSRTERLDAFRDIRDAIKARLDRWLQQERVSVPSDSIRQLD